jgi:hypothetical protein
MPDLRVAVAALNSTLAGSHRPETITAGSVRSRQTGSPGSSLLEERWLG